MKMKYINYQVLTGQENMRIDSDLLDSAIENKLDYPIFRLYAWKPACVSLGRNQKDDFLDRSFLKENEISSCIRRRGLLL